MRIDRYLAGVAGLALSLLCARADTNDTMSALRGGLSARVHYVGTEALQSDSNAVRLRHIGELPETVALRDYIIGKLSVVPHELIQERAGSSNDYSKVFTRLFGDLLSHEVYFASAASTNSIPEAVLAVQLDAVEANIWRSDLQEVLSNWTGMPATNVRAAGFEGWELRKHHDPDVIQFFRAGDWVVFGWGSKQLRLVPETLKNISSNKRPVTAARGYWLDAAVDWPELSKHGLSPGGAKLPKMRLTVEGRKDAPNHDFVRPKLVMDFASPLNLKLPRWQVPTNTIHGRTVSFGAARGISGWLAQWPVLSMIKAAPLPDQYFGWSYAQFPFEMYFAAPVAQGTNYFRKIEPQLLAGVTAEFQRLGVNVSSSWTNDQLSWGGFPIAFPFVEVLRESTGDYLLAGAMPGPKRVDPMLRIFEDQLNHPDVIAYSWELTPERIKQWNNLIQIYYMHRKTPLLDTSAPADQWLTAVETNLDTCITVVTQTGPAQVTLVRNSALGLSSLDLTVLGYWLDASGFPLSWKREIPRWRIPPSANSEPGAAPAPAAPGSP